MILYESSNWCGVVFTFAGTVWPGIWAIWMTTNMYILASYYLSLKFQVNFGVEGRTILLSTMAFLLIFRANQAYARYWEGRSFVSAFFSDIREFLLLAMLYIRGGCGTSTCLFHTVGNTGQRFPIEDAFDAKAREARVDVIRLSVALAVCFKLHTRIAFGGYCFGQIESSTKWRADWDRFRIGQLVSPFELMAIERCVGIVDDEEVTRMDATTRLNHWADQFHGGESAPPEWPSTFEVDQEPLVRLPILMMFFLRHSIVRNMNGISNDLPWGIRERFVPTMSGLVSSMMHSFEMANQIMVTPVPLPYANLMRTLMLVFLFSMPFFIDYRLGWFVNTVIPLVMSLALLGIDAIGTELENPFGDDANDLDIDELIHGVECEAMELLTLTGDERGCHCFVWRKLPAFIEEASCRPLRRQLAVKVFAVGEGNLEPVEDDTDSACRVAQWPSATTSSLFSQGDGPAE